MKELVYKFFSCRTTPLQKREIDNWLKKDQNKTTYLLWLEDWENKNPEYQPDLEKHLQKFVAFIKNHSGDTRSGEVKILKNEKTKIINWKFSMAAAMIVLIALTGGWVFKDKFLYQQYEASYGEVKTLVLEDGSMVTLNGNSSIKVPRWNFKSNREVFLQGEANFSVSHTGDGKQFVVKTANQFEVKVMGTEFSVLTRERGSRVLLTKGKVEVGYLQGSRYQRLTMKPGEVVTLDHERIKTPVVTPLDAKDRAGMIWEHRRFEFNSTTLNEIAGILHDTYGFEVKLAAPALGGQKLSGSYTADSVEDLLQAVGEMMDVHIERDGNQLTVESKK